MQQNPKELYFQQTLALTDKDFKIIEPYLIPEIESYFKPIQTFASERFGRTEMSAITANLYCCWLNNADLIYSRDKAAYSIVGVKNQYSSTPYKFRLNYKKMMFVMDHLTKMDLINQKMGSYNHETGKGQRTRVFLSEEIKNIFHQYRTNLFLFECIQNEIILRNDQKLLVNYEDNDEIELMRQNCRLFSGIGYDFCVEFSVSEEDVNKMITYITTYTALRECKNVNENELFEDNEEMNRSLIREALQQHQWYLNDDGKAVFHVHPNQLIYKRIFNRSSFQLGGRFYCKLQSLRKEYRSTFTFDGQPTVELDFACFHPRMLYNLLGTNPQEDLYVTGIYRNVSKAWFQKLLNAEGKTGCMYGLTRDFPKLTKNERDLIASETESKNEAIKDYFFKNMGLKLMYLDSQIAEQIMLTFIHADKPIICIHDSFVVKASDVEMLRYNMIKYYKQFVGEQFDPVIK